MPFCHCMSVKRKIFKVEILISQVKIATRLLLMDLFLFKVFLLLPLKIRVAEENREKTFYFKFKTLMRQNEVAYYIFLNIKRYFTLIQKSLELYEKKYRNLCHVHH